MTTTAKDFNAALIGLAQLSMATSRIAVDKAANGKVKEFAGFELAETTAITKILTDLGTVIPVTDEKTKDELSGIESSETGIAFDRSYIKLQLNNHKLLRDLTEEYLKEAPADKLDKEEAKEKHLAMLALTIFNQHIAIIENIDQQLSNAEIL